MSDIVIPGPMRSRPLERFRSVFCAAALVVLAATSLSSAQQRQSAESEAVDSIVAFVDVAVFPMDQERLLEHQTVLIRGPIIAAIGPAASVKVPQSAVRI